MRYNMQSTRAAVYTGWEMFHALDEIERCHALLDRQQKSWTRELADKDARIAELSAVIPDLRCPLCAEPIVCCCPRGHWHGGIADAKLGWDDPHYEEENNA